MPSTLRILAINVCVPHADITAEIIFGISPWTFEA